MRSFAIATGMLFCLVIGYAVATYTPSASAEASIDPVVKTADDSIRWVKMDNDGLPSETANYVAKVQGGWLVLVHTYDEKGTRGGGSGFGYGVGAGNGVTFVPDPNHTWLDVD